MMVELCYDGIRQFKVTTLNEYYKIVGIELNGKFDASLQSIKIKELRSKISTATLSFKISIYFLF